MSEPATTTHGDESYLAKGDLRSRSFLGLLVTQLLGAFNDNMFRWFVAAIGKDIIGEKGASTALSVGLAFMVLPFILLAAPAGYLADRFSKRDVIVGCKLGEVAVMLLGLVAIWIGNFYFLIFVLFLMGSQSALFGPSKLGIIPEILRPEKISVGNGVVALTTVVAIVLGAVAGNYLYDYACYDFRVGAYFRHAEWAAKLLVIRSNLWLLGLALVGTAGVGVASSLFVRFYRPANPSRSFPFNAPLQMARDLSALARNRALFRVALGIAFFWSLAALAQLNVDVLGTKHLGLEQKDVGPLVAILSIGVGLGSVLAGLWSAGKVELGIVPLGAAGIAICSMLIFFVPAATPIDDATHVTASIAAAVQSNATGHRMTAVLLFLLGFSAGLYDVPLAAFIQHRSPAASRGSILAASNLLTFSGTLAASGIFYLLTQPLNFSATSIFLLLGILTIPVALYAFAALPQATIRCLVFLATRTIYRVRAFGRDHLPETGGALLVANHVTWIDGVLLLTTSSRPIRLVIRADLISGPVVGWLAKVMGVISVKSGAAATQAAIREARASLDAGELVCIFPEGGMTRSGRLTAFQPELMELWQGSSTPVIPVYLDELWGSIFSFERGRFFWKLPMRWPYPVSIWFGSPLKAPTDIGKVREAVQSLGDEALENRTARSKLLPQKFIRECRRKRWQIKATDSTGAEATGGGLLTRTLILRRLLLRDVLAPDEEYVGLLLPPSLGGVIANAAVTLCRRVSANLNYTVSSDVMNECIAQAGIRHVLTSRRVMEKLDLSLNAEIVYLEDFRENVTLVDKLVAAFEAQLLPAWMLDRILGLNRVSADDTLTVIFTSGSTGQPKGVLLSQRAVLANVEAIDQVVNLRSDDVILGVLPFFHSFGFSITLWTVLGIRISGVYHFTPLEPRQVGKLCEKHGATVLLATPTFLRSYLKRCAAEQLATLEVIVVGAEKMPVELAEAFEQKFGARPVEGYGATELAPLVSVNVPACRSLSDEVDCKEGSVGRAVPGVRAKVVDPETMADLPVDTPGMLLVKGPNVMLGYLGQPEKTAEVMHGGWYITGDIATIDAEGFITITGRQSRFSKIGGEMVPHIRIEEEIQKFLGGDELLAVVTSVPDAKKGERLVVLHTKIDASPDDICGALSKAGLPNLWIPSTDSFFEIDEIPVLGSGKLDLRRMKEIAERMTGGGGEHE